MNPQPTQSAPRDGRTTPPGASGKQFTVLNWKPFVKNTLTAFLSLELPSGLVLHDLTYHVKGDSRWVSLSARQYTKTDGSTSWLPMIEFTSKESRQRFQAAALEAVDRYLAEVREES